MIPIQDDRGWFTRAKDGGEMLNLHPLRACDGKGCAIHNHPSQHPLNEATLNWRDDRGILERICAHGVGHPDADSAKYLSSIGKGWANTHGCDGCCGKTD